MVEMREELPLVLLPALGQSPQEEHSTVTGGWGRHGSDPSSPTGLRFSPSKMGRQRPSVTVVTAVHCDPSPAPRLRRRRLLLLL